MVQQTERFSERITVYVTPSMHIRFERAVEASDIQPADWLRRCIENELVRLEAEEIVEGGAPGEVVSGMPVSSQLAAAEARLESQEEVSSLLRERLGMADAQNIELNKRLEEAHSTVDRAMLALPAPAESAGPTRRGWQFWRR